MHRSHVAYGSVDAGGGQRWIVSRDGCKAIGGQARHRVHDGCKHMTFGRDLAGAQHEAITTSVGFHVKIIGGPVTFSATDVGAMEPIADMMVIRDPSDRLKLLEVATVSLPRRFASVSMWMAVRVHAVHGFAASKNLHISLPIPGGDDMLPLYQILVQQRNYGGVRVQTAFGILHGVSGGGGRGGGHGIAAHGYDPWHQIR